MKGCKRLTASQDQLTKLARNEVVNGHLVDFELAAPNQQVPSVLGDLGHCEEVPASRRGQRSL